MMMQTLNNGNKFPLFGLGTYLIRGQDLINAVFDEALAVGYRSFDTAAVYWNEEDIGNALNDLLPKYELQRSDVFVTTKLAPSDQGKGKARQAALKSLQKLKTPYIDLYLIHWPGVEGVPLDSNLNQQLRSESWLDLVQLHKEGVLKNIGVSNYTIAHLTELLSNCDGVKPAVNQVEFHPMQQQKELLSFCKAQNILFQAYSSFGGGGKTNILMDHANVQYVCKNTNKTPAQVLLKWALQKGVAVIPKSATPERIRENFELNFSLNDEEMKSLDNIKEVMKFSWEPLNVK